MTQLGASQANQGTPPFWRGRLLQLRSRFGQAQKLLATDVYLDIEKDEAERREAKLEASPIAQLVRAPH